MIECVFWKALVCSLWQPQIIVQIRSLLTFSNPRLPTATKTLIYFMQGSAVKKTPTSSKSKILHQTYCFFFYSWLPVRFEYTESCTCQLKVIIRVGLIIWNSLLSSMTFFFLFWELLIKCIDYSIEKYFFCWQSEFAKKQKKIQSKK